MYPAFHTTISHDYLSDFVFHPTWHFYSHMPLSTQFMFLLVAAFLLVLSLMHLVAATQAGK